MKSFKIKTVRKVVDLGHCVGVIQARYHGSWKKATLIIIEPKIFEDGSYSPAQSIEVRDLENLEKLHEELGQFLIEAWEMSIKEDPQ